MRGPGQVENPQYGCKVDNKYDAIADFDDPFEALEHLETGRVVIKDAGNEKVKPKSAGEKQAVSGSGGAKKAESKKEGAAAGKPQSVTGGKQQDGGAKKQQGEHGGARERPKTAGDKPARADHAQHEQRRPRGGAAARGGAVPQQAGVVGLMTSAGSEGAAAAQQAAGVEEERGGAGADGFQQQRPSGDNRGRRGGPRGGYRGAYRGPYRGGARSAPQAGDQEAGEAQAATAGTDVQNEGAEGEDRLERNFERRQRPFGYGGFRGAYSGYGRRGAYRRGAPGAGNFEEGTGRKREFERHSGSDVTGVRAVDKKEGGGQHNWGTMQDDLEGQTETAEGEQAATGEKRAGDPGVTEAKLGEAWTDLVHADESAKAAEGASGDGTQQDKMYVLDDWKAKEEKERFRVPEFNVRKPNEGVDASSKWDGFVLKKRDIEEAAEPEDAVDDDAPLGLESGDDGKRKGKQRLNIPVKFASSAHRGRGSFNAGRGGPRGGMGQPQAEFREGGAFRGGFDRPRQDRGGFRGGNRAGFRGGAAGGASGAPQLSMDEFPSLNKQAA